MMILLGCVTEEHINYSDILQLQLYMPFCQELLATVTFIYIIFTKTD